MNKNELEQKLISLKQIHPITGCWRFLGYINPQTDYGHTNYNGVSQPVHRLSAYLYLELDLDDTNQFACHRNEICYYKDCWNPDHLYIGDRSSNTLDIVKQGNHNNARKTHCPQGHLLVGENIYLTPKGSRECWVCKRERARVYAANKRKSDKSQATKI